MSTIPSGVREITITWLELRSREQLRPATLDDPELLLLAAREPAVGYSRFLYDAVGRDYAWTDRRAWSDTALYDYLARPTTTLLVLYWRGVPAGYLELNAASDEPGTEIAYFGVLPAFHGRGFGKHLLSLGARRAFDDGATRVWLHTCTLDGPHALANYQARGFTPYRTLTEPYEPAAGVAGGAP